MTGSPSVTYNPPPPDDSNKKFLEYVRERELKQDQEALKLKQEEAAAKSARQASARAAFPALITAAQKELTSGISDFQTVSSRIRDYASKYDLESPEKYISDITTTELGLVPQRRQSAIETTYKELLGRAPTSQELSSAQKAFTLGTYKDASSFRDALSKSPEYTKKFNQSYLDNYYDTMFGKQTLDAKGEKTGKRTFTFDRNLLPEYGGDLASKAKISLPSFGSFTGTVEEINAQRESIKDTRQYLYSAGLTNLQGEIDKEVTKLKSESSKDLAKISAQSNLYSSLASGFWS